MTARRSEPELKIHTDFDGVGHILRDRRLSVPDYQRSYSWGLAQVEEFWADLRSAISHPDPEYFLGTVVFTPDQSHEHIIIDGQQRLATTTMLLVAIRNAFLSKSDDNRASVIELAYVASTGLITAELEPKLRLNPADAEYFADRVIAHPSERVPDPAHASNHRIKDAFEFLTAKIEQEVEAAGDNWDEAMFKWVDFLDRNVRVIVVDVPTDADAFLIFETLNDRGLALTIADLLKNALFGLAGADLPEVQANWARAIEALEIPTEEQTFVTFLRHYWSSTVGATRERDLYRSLRSSVRSQQQAVELAKDLAESAELYAAILDPSHDYWTSIGDDVEAAMQTLRRLRLEQYRPLLLSAMQAMPHAQVGRLVIALVNWVVRGIVVGGIGGGTTERYYSEAAIAVRHGNVTTAEEVQALLSRIISSDDVFQSAFEQKREARVWLARYLLLALERTQDSAQNASIVSDHEDSQWTVVPILSATAMQLEWASDDPDAAMQWTKRLGNQALVTKATASEFKNLEWPERFITLSETSITSSRLGLGALESTDAWSQDAIRNRQRTLAEWALVAWPRDPH